MKKNKTKSPYGTYSFEKISAVNNMKENRKTVKTEGKRDLRGGK